MHRTDDVRRTRPYVLAMCRFFRFLADLLEVSDSTLSQTLTVLSDAGLVSLRKEPVGRRTRTWVAISDTGREAFARHRSTLQAIIEAGTDTDTAVQHRGGQRRPPPGTPRRSQRCRRDAHRRARAVAAYRRATGRWPSKHAADARTARLGLWLRDQRAAANDPDRPGRWSPARHAYLDRLAPGREAQARTAEMASSHCMVRRAPRPGPRRALQSPRSAACRDD